MLKGLIIIDNEFEETELLLTRDLLKRSGIAVQIVSLSNTLYLTSSTNLQIRYDLNFPVKNYQDYDFLILTGGVWVVNFNANANSTLKEELYRCIKDFVKNKKLVAAICAAPLMLYNANVLPKNFTVYPAIRKLMNNVTSLNELVVVDGNIITGRAMGATFDFAYAIVNYLLGEDKVKNLQQSVLGLSQE